MTAGAKNSFDLRKRRVCGVSRTMQENDVNVANFLTVIDGRKNESNCINERCRVGDEFQKWERYDEAEIISPYREERERRMEYPCFRKVRSIIADRKR